MTHDWINFHDWFNLKNKAHNETAHDWINAEPNTKRCFLGFLPQTR